MTIDAKKLQSVLNFSAHWKGSGGVSLCAADFAILHDAAAAYAASLPREVERVWFEVLKPNMRCDGVYENMALAQDAAAESPGSVIVRLTGTAVLPRVKD